MCMVQVLASMPDMPSLQAAAAGAADCLDFDALLVRQMYRTAVALLSKRSGKPPCDMVVSPQSQMSRQLSKLSGITHWLAKKATGFRKGCPAKASGRRAACACQSRRP
jgi:hypothetical protein